MNIPQRRRLFELGEDTVAEAILDVLRTQPDSCLTTSEVVEAMGLPAWKGGMSLNPERGICEGVLAMLADRDQIDMIPPTSDRQGYRWMYAAQ